MIALVASAMLGLYVLIPVLIFDKVLAGFVPAKRVSRTRTEEIAFGLVVAAVPILTALALSHFFWFVGHWPFALNEAADASAGRDYKIIVMALESDSYFTHNEASVWTAAEHVKDRQARFLCWTYLFLAIQSSVFTALVYNYGKLSKHALYRRFSRLFIRNVADWHVLLTAYTFDPGEKRTVLIDVLTRDGLYSGIIREGKYFFKPDGSLSGLLLSETRRYRRELLLEDRKNHSAKPSHQYWVPVTGGQLYIPAEAISNINIRYEMSTENVAQQLQAEVSDNEEIKQLLIDLNKSSGSIKVKIGKSRIIPTAETTERDPPIDTPPSAPTSPEIY